MASKPIMQFKAELMDAHIPIWRRFQVMNDVRFSRLAYILMSMFEMQGGHLFAFRVDVAANAGRQATDDFTAARIAKEYNDAGFGDIEFQMPIAAGWIADAQEVMETPVKDATREYVKWHVTHIGDELYFEYDFGDGWEIKLTLEDVFEDKELHGRNLPRVIEGEGYGIIEDCGGTGGLEHLDEVFKRGNGSEYEELREWLGEDELDLTEFDINIVNELLKTDPAILKDSYESDIERAGS